MKWTVLQQKYPNKYLVKHVKGERTKKDNQRKPQIWAWVFQHAQTYVSNKGKELPPLLFQNFMSKILRSYY
jgi:hypothetical protein